MDKNLAYMNRLCIYVIYDREKIIDRYIGACIAENKTLGFTVDCRVQFRTNGFGI